MRTLAFRDSGRLVDNIEYDFVGTPRQWVIGVGYAQGLVLDKPAPITD